jgi:kynurenine formamidase
MSFEGNWGRWGTDDERGALNEMTAEVVLAAASVVRKGAVYSLGRELGPAAGGAGRAAQHFMTLDGGDYAAGLAPDRTPVGQAYADDTLIVPVHGAGTHIDALCHVWEGGEIFNGHSSSTIRSYGAARCGIENAPAFTLRGVLLDVPASRGIDRLVRGDVIGRADLERCCEEQGIEILPGDAVLIRTGIVDVGDAADEAEPGLDVDAASLLAELRVIVVGSDNTAIEPVRRNPGPKGMMASADVHLLLIHKAGIYLVELLDLESLAADRVFEFLFVMAPLRIRGGTGSPVNPIAIA